MFSVVSKNALTSLMGLLQKYIEPSHFYRGNAYVLSFPQLNLLNNQFKITLRKYIYKEAFNKHSSKATVHISAVGIIFFNFGLC